jgi:hypothetical protein
MEFEGRNLSGDSSSYGFKLGRNLYLRNVVYDLILRAKQFDIGLVEALK